MQGRIFFRYLHLDDLVIATPSWNIETAADVASWYEQYEAYLTRFKRRMDLIAVLDDFTVQPVVAEMWGAARARTHQHLTRHSCRVHSSARVRMYHNTSGVRYDVSRQEAASVADAIECIRALRVQHGEAQSMAPRVASFRR